MTISFICSSCDHNLKVKDELAGRKVKCPRCGGVTAVPSEDEGAAVAAGPPPRASRAAREEPDEDDRPRKKKKKKKQGGNGMLIALGAGGAALIGVIVVVVILLTGGREQPPVKKGGPVAELPPEILPPKKEEPATDIGKGVRPGSGIRARADRPNRLNELRQIGLFYQGWTTERGRPPSDLEAFVKSLQREAPAIAQAIRENPPYYKILLNVRSGIVAYEYDPDTNGLHGVVDTGAAASDISTQELQALIKGQGK